jgi:hypothetical protein
MHLFHKRSTFYILLVSTIVMIVLMFLQGKPLTTPATPAGIISLELAARTDAVLSVIESWEEAGSTDGELIQVAIRNTWLDFLFLTCYSLFLFTAARQLSSFFKCKKFFNAVALAALAAGLLDIIENAGMLQSLQGKGSPLIALLTAIAAYCKWITVFFVIGFLLTAGIIRLFRQKRDRFK